MKYVKLGEVTASAMIMGCMRIDTMSVAEAERWVDAALAVGIDIFDHADIYGGGRCESVFGQVLKAHSGLREKLMLQSKCGIQQGYYDLSEQHILTSVDHILERLGTDYLDVFILHRPDALVEPEAVASAMDKLSASGKVRQFGVSNMNGQQMTLLSQYCHQRFVVNQLQFGPAHTGLVDRGIHVNMEVPFAIDRDGGTLDYCRFHHVTIQTWSSLQYGIFEGTFLNNDKYSELNACLQRIGDVYGISRGAVALAWILRHPAGMQSVMGTTNPERIRELAAGADVCLTRQEWYEIYRAAGHTLP